MGGDLTTRTDGWADVVKAGHTVFCFYERLKKNWLLRHYSADYLRKLRTKSGSVTFAKIRMQYRAACMARWTKLAAALRVNYMLGRLSEFHVRNHEARRHFSVGAYMSLQWRHDLFKRTASGEYLELNDDDHAKIVADGLFRAPKHEMLRPPTFNWRTVLEYVHEWDRWHGTFSISHQGHHAKTKWLLDDASFRRRFEEYVQAEGERKGKKNLTAAELTRWVNDTLFLVGSPGALLTKGVNQRTVQNWLKRCGFGFEKQAKAGYKDGTMQGHNGPQWGIQNEESLAVPI
jgi:hypothetical protein